MEQFRVSSLQDTNDVQLSSNHSSAMMKYLPLVMLSLHGLFVKVNGNIQCKKIRKVCIVAEQPLSVASHLFLLRTEMN